MNRTILYYPTINIPNDEWLRHALLYYDQVSSIIPENWENERLIELSADIEYLIGEDQFRPIKPEKLITGGNNWQEFDEFRNEFQEIISNTRFKNTINRSKSFYSVHHSQMDLNREFRIHSNKTSDSIFYFLEELGLARRSENPEWLLFEEHTALLYMALMAKYLADIDENQTTIGTDQKTYENWNFKKVNDINSFPVVSISFDKILPVPRPNVPLERIIDFKRLRGDNLNHFKKILSDFQIKVSQSKSQAEFKEACITFKETLTNGVKDLNDVIADSRIETISKGFKSMISLKTPPGIAAAGVALNEYFNLAHIPFNYEAFSVGALGLVEIAGSFIESRNKQRAQLRNSPFSYLYYANKRGITFRQR